MKHLDDNVDVFGLEVERTQLKSQLKQVVGAKDKFQERMDNLNVEDKYYDRKYEDMSIRWNSILWAGT